MPEFTGLDDDHFDSDLRLPTRGTLYWIPAPSADEGLRLHQLVRRDSLDNDEETAKIARVLGPAHARMLDDGVPIDEYLHAGRTALRARTSSTTRQPCGRARSAPLRISLEVDRDNFDRAVRDARSGLQGVDTVATTDVSNFGDSVEANMDSAAWGFDFGVIDSGSSAAEIENLISKAETLNTVLGTETEDSLRGVSALVKSGLVPNVNAAFDLIVAGRQQGMNAQGDLIDSISEYSAGWGNSGLSAQTAMALINQSMDLGVDNTDRGADAIREFGRRVTEEGETIVGALDEIGLSGREMYEAFVRGGPDAEAAFYQAFDAIRAIEDSVKRNAAAMALLGDTSGDFIAAFTQWDPSEAVSKFGSVEGAADRAAATIGGTTASSMESARRSIETSADAIELALAEAFGPTLQKAANWVSANRAEIISFFTDLAGAGFSTLDGILAFASGSLRGFASLTDGISDMVGTNLGILGSFAEGLGRVLSSIPGMGDEGGLLESTGRGLQAMSEGLAESGDKARAAADSIDSTIRPALTNLGVDVSLAGNRAADAARLMTALGDEVTAIPDGKSIVIDSNSSEQTEKLEALGLKVTALPDGTFRIDSNTDDGQTVIDNFVAANNGRTITMNVRRQALNPMPGVVVPQAGSGTGYDGTIVGALGNEDGNIVRQYAGGGINDLTPMSGRQAQIVPPNTWRVVGDRARNDEFFIPDTNEPQHVSLGAEWARRRGLALVDQKAISQFADGGLGLGGYTGPDTRDYMRPSNLSEVVAPASGLGFTAVSGVSNYASMAASGQIDASKLVPEFDTSNNSIPGLDRGLQQLTEVMTEVLETLQKGGLVEAKLDMSARLTKAGIA